MPVSLTEKTSRTESVRRSVQRTRTSTCPRAVNLIALPTRFAIT